MNQNPPDDQSRPPSPASAAAAGYALRPTTIGDTTYPNDYIFRWSGHDVGRTYKGEFASRQAWRWTIYITAYVHQVEGVPIAGLADSLEAAKAEFRGSFEKMIAAGVVRLERFKPE